MLFLINQIYLQIYFTFKTNSNNTADLIQFVYFIDSDEFNEIKTIKIFFLLIYYLNTNFYL